MLAAGEHVLGDAVRLARVVPQPALLVDALVADRADLPLALNPRVAYRVDGRAADAELVLRQRDYQVVVQIPDALGALAVVGDLDLRRVAVVLGNLDAHVVHVVLLQAVVALIVVKDQAAVGERGVELGREDGAQLVPLLGVEAAVILGLELLNLLNGLETLYALGEFFHSHVKCPP